MSRDFEVVEDLKFFALLNKWKVTLGRAREQAKQRGQIARRGCLRTRFASLLPIKRPVFILGCPRSGTTFLGQVMDSIPGSSYYFEPPILKYYSRLVYQGTAGTTRTSCLYRAVLHSLLLAAPGNGPRVIEKNPTHTWIAESLLQSFPDARFVFIHRDGRDVALSLAAKPWHQRDAAAQGKREPGGYLYGPYPHFYIEPDRHDEFQSTTDYHRAIWIWRRYAEEMARLKRTLPETLQFHMSYEELVQQPKDTLEPMLRFLDEPSSVLGSVLEAANQGHGASVGKWRTQLSAEERATTATEAGEMLRILGYAARDAALF